MRLALKLAGLPVALAVAFASPAAANEAGHPHWGYSGKEGPGHWGGACETGKSQSPIDLGHAVDKPLPALAFHYQAGGYRVVNNGHAVQVDFKPGSTLTLDGVAYELKQLHFHAPSENTIGGKSFPLEAHLVHADAKGHLAVLALMFEPGADNAWLAGISASVPTKAGSENALAAPIAAKGLLPANRDYFRFDGSLTTPPCSEGVRWLVLKHPAAASAKEIAQLHAAVGFNNNRPIQPRNDRVVLE